MDAPHLTAPPPDERTAAWLGPGARRHVHRVLRHRGVVAPAPASAELVHVARPARRAVPDHPGRARHDRDRVDPAAAGQALDRPPPAGRVAAGAVGLHAVERLALLPLVGGACSCSCRGWRTSPAGTRGGSSSPGPTTGRRGSRSGRWSSTSGPRRRPPGRAAPAPGAGRRRRLSPPIAAAFLGGGPRRRGPRCWPPPAGTVRRSAPMSVLAQRRPGGGRRACRSTRRRRGPASGDAARDPGYRLAVEGDVARPLALSLADLRALPSPRRCCRSPASRAGARRRGGGASGCATCSALAGSRATARRVRSSRCSAGGRYRRSELHRRPARRPRHPARPRPRRRAARTSTTATRSG